MKKAKLNYTKQGYSYIKCTREDCFNWGGGSICDNCGNPMEEMYLIFILGRALCQDCFDEWIERSTRYEEDLQLQRQNHLRWYKAHGFDVYEEENNDI